MKLTFVFGGSGKIDKTDTEDIILFGTNEIKTKPLLRLNADSFR